MFASWGGVSVLQRTAIPKGPELGCEEKGYFLPAHLQSGQVEGCVDARGL